MLGQNCSWSGNSLHEAQTLQYWQTYTFIWLTLKRASSFPACDCVVNEKLSQTQWSENSGEWDTHSSKVLQRSHGPFPLGEKTPCFPYRWTLNEVIRMHLAPPLMTRDSRVEGELAGEAGIMGIEENHIQFRNIYDQQVEPGFYWFWPKSATRFTYGIADSWS